MFTQDMTVNGFRQASEVKVWSSVSLSHKHTQTQNTHTNTQNTHNTHTHTYTHTHARQEALNILQISSAVLHFMKVNITAAEHSDGKREGVTINESYSFLCNSIPGTEICGSHILGNRTKER
jgi:hypothetical protein